MDAVLAPDSFGIDLADVDQLSLHFERQRMETHLLEFVRAAWHLVEPSQPFVENWHIGTLCNVLEDVYHKRIRRVIINIPPGTMKSLLVSVFFPAWVWANNPRERFLMASYGQTLSTRDNVRCRLIIESPWFQDRWPVQLLDDQNTKTRYNTNKNGWRVATSVNGVGTGEHPDYIIIDDATTAQQAESETERTSANDWFDRTISSRLGRNPAILVIGQRLHEDDLPGHLLKRTGWTHVCWPMRFEAAKPDPLDARTQDGELLFPAMFPEEKVKQLELDLGAYGASGQLQQHPSPVGGGLFKRGWFKIVDALPADYRRIIRGWDTAASEAKGDYTCGCKMLETKAQTYIIADMQRDQLSPEGVDALMLTTAQLDGRRCPQREEREGGASGKAQIAARAKLLKGYDYKEVNLGQSKVIRSKPLRAQAEAGNVALLRGTWNEAFLVELCDFPNAVHDDQVDAASCAFNSLMLEPVVKKVSSSW